MKLVKLPPFTFAVSIGLRALIDRRKKDGDYSRRKVKDGRVCLFLISPTSHWCDSDSVCFLEYLCHVAFLC